MNVFKEAVRMVPIAAKVSPTDIFSQSLDSADWELANKHLMLHVEFV